MKKEKAISVDGVSKNFKLPHLQANSIKSLFTGMYRKDGNSNTEIQHALKDISFDVNKGEFFGIVGRNGSGKSTLLKILAGIYQPTKGSVVTIGKLVPFIELGVGFNPELSGRENVYLNGAMLGFAKNEITEMYDDIVNFAELERFMDQKLKNYSSGMQVRLAFSLAIRAKADILLIDEVLAVGDADFQRKCFEYFRKLKKAKKTVVFVSHDMNAIKEYCDRAVLIDNSELVVQGSADEVASKYMQMFNPAQYQVENKADDSKQWGSGSAKITDVKLLKTVLTNMDNELVVSMKVKASKAFNNSIIPGFIIKNEAGQALMGTNSKIIDVDIKPIDSGATIEFIWKIPNIFNESTYVVDLALVDGEDMSICWWWEEATAFQVVNTEKTPYIVAPKIGLSIKE